LTLPDRETIAISAFFFGIALALVGMILLIARAFARRLWLGAIALLLPPTAPLLALTDLRRSRGALLTFLIGVVIFSVPYILVITGTIIDLGERERIVDGQRHLTLTGWNRKDYSLLALKRDTVVLQMANADVTDTTLGLLRGFDRLRELDIGGANVTPAGLAKLAELPALEDLKLAGTALDDAGFATIATLPKLKTINVSRTKVTDEAIEAWRSAGEGRKAVTGRPRVRRTPSEPTKG
jgi:hypothetical protein